MVMDVLDFDNHRKGFDFRFAKMSQNAVVLVVFYVCSIINPSRAKIYKYVCMYVPKIYNP